MTSLTNTVVLSGQCACTQVTWQSTTPALHLDFCFCHTCQRVTGSAFGSWIGIPRSQLTWSGPIHTYTVSTLASRTMCKNCGSCLSIQYRCYPDKTHVAAGTVTRGAETLPKVGVYIFVKEAPCWYNVPNDAVVRYDGFDGEFLEVQKQYEERSGVLKEEGVRGGKG